MTSLRSVLLLQRDLPRAVAFYRDGLGLALTVCTETWAEFETGTHTRLTLQAAEGEAFCTAGFTPMLTFDVKDLQRTLGELLKRGGTMDGPVQYPVQGKVASIRAPDGHMLALFERSEERLSQTVTSHVSKEDDEGIQRRHN